MKIIYLGVIRTISRKKKIIYLIRKSNFFDWDYDNVLDHTGIVDKVENREMYTIENNSRDEGKKRKIILKIINLFMNIEFKSNF